MQPRRRVFLYYEDKLFFASFDSLVVPDPGGLRGFLKVAFSAIFGQLLHQGINFLYRRRLERLVGQERQGKKFEQFGGPQLAAEGFSGENILPRWPLIAADFCIFPEL